MFGRMNILLASNDYYVFPATVLIESLLINHRDTDVHIFYMYDTLKEKSKKKLQKLVERSSNGTLTLVPVNQDVFRDAPVNTYFTKETYFRFLAASCLPAEVSRVLYLDVDIMVKGSILDFYSQSFVENGAERSFVVCEERDLTINKQIHENLNLPENSKYFNAGVLLMNLDKLERLWIGCYTYIPAKWVEKFQAKHPDCVVNTTEQTGCLGSWRAEPDGSVAPRYALLREQFEYDRYPSVCSSF